MQEGQRALGERYSGSGTREAGHGTRDAGKEDPFPHLRQETTLLLENESQRMRTRLLSNVDVKLPQNQAQQQSSGPWPRPISTGIIFVASPINADAARKFPELSREGPLTWIHPPDDFVHIIVQEEKGRRK